eukprot:2343770-Rhodomonas_salina.3
MLLPGRLSEYPEKFPGSKYTAAGSNPPSVLRAQPGDGDIWSITGAKVALPCSTQNELLGPHAKVSTNLSQRFPLSVADADDDVSALST